MSKPQNILAKYRTYSYHHVLIACENTQVADELANSTNLYDYLNDKVKDRHEPRKLKKTDGEYVVIINGLTDADFHIKEAKWISIIAPEPEPGSKNKEQFASIAVEGSMQIMEPRGVRFLNVLGKASDALGVDPTGLTYLLKTFFVGHTDKGIVEHISYIKPIELVIVDITATLDVTGAIYIIDFVSITNGAAKLPQYVKGADRVSFNLGNNLHEAIEVNFSKRINCEYKIHYDELNDLALKVTGKPLVGQAVNYVFEIDEKYREYIINQDPVNKKETGGEKGGNISFGENPSIESALIDILKRSKQIGDDAKGIENKNTIGKVVTKKYFPKVLSTISSGKRKGKRFYDVIYKVVKVEAPVSTFEEIQKGDDSVVSKGNSVEFDYFFSGKNTDILEFNIQMQMGLTFFQTMVTAEGVKKTTADARDFESTPKTTSKNAPMSKSTNTKSGPRPNTPILFSTIITEPKNKNKVYPLSDSDFQSLLARHAAFEMLDAKITILGNPILLGNMMLLSSDIVQKKKPSPSEYDIVRDWTTTPGLVKVNIFMPNEEGRIQNGDFSKEQFWYRGWYYMLSVEHIFSDGQFTQIIDMQSFPLNQYLSKTDEEPKKPADEKDKKKNVDTKYYKIIEKCLGK